MSLGFVSLFNFYYAANTTSSSDDSEACFERDLQQRLKQHPNFSQLERAIMALQPLGQNLDRECTVVIEPPQLTDDPAIVDLPEADGDLHLVWRRIAQMHVVHVRKHLVVVLAGIATTNVVADIERQPETGHGLTKLDSCLGIFRQMPRLGFQRQPDAGGV